MGHPIASVGVTETGLNRLAHLDLVHEIVHDASSGSRSSIPWASLEVAAAAAIGVGRGDLAYVAGTYSLTIVMPEAPAAADTGKYIEIWNKQGDGSWKLTRDLFNSDIPILASAPPPPHKD